MYDLDKEIVINSISNPYVADSINIPKITWDKREKSLKIPRAHPTTGYLDNRCYRELRSYLRHTEWQVGISLTFFFHFIYFLDYKFISDLLHYKWEICIPNMTVSFQSMKIEFDIFNREFFKTLTFSLKFQKKVSIIYMNNIVFLLPSCTTWTQSVM